MMQIGDVQDMQKSCSKYLLGGGEGGGGLGGGGEGGGGLGGGGEGGGGLGGGGPEDGHELTSAEVLASNMNTTKKIYNYV